MNNKLIMQSLPLVASVLGSKYGVKVAIGGNHAFTDGKTIQLPGLRLDYDKTLISLTRGYIDHESAHIRETDFVLLEKAKLSPLELNIWNSIEDWMVEQKLATLFPGCRMNFNWLIRYFFVQEKAKKRSSPANLIPDWILLKIRSWDVGDVKTSMDKIETIIEKQYPGLVDQLKSVLQEVRVKCSTTGDSILYAKEIVTLLKNIAKGTPPTEDPIGMEMNESNFDKNANPVQEPRGDKNKNNRLSDSHQQLEKLINSSNEDLPKGMGEVLAEDLGKSIPDNAQDMIRVAVIGNRMFKPFSPEKLEETKRSSTALKTRLQSMMQALLLKRSRIGRQGRLATHQLHKIAIADPRMFIQHEEKKGFNTAVHILIDCSGSMRTRMDLTAMACHALTMALSSIKGINVGITAFPAKPPLQKPGNNNEKVGVCPVVRHGESVHSKFHTKASGCTPMSEAVWWILQQMIPLKESRKIILVLTDGSPDCLPSTTKVIEHGWKLGFEFYGIGINDNTIKAVLPNQSCTIKELSQLAPAMFEIMKNAFINNK